MSTPIQRRLAAIEAALAEVVEFDPRPAHMLSDAECVKRWHRLCHHRPPGAPRPRQIAAAEAEQLLAEWRRVSSR
jgi:hypothetical protein